MKDKFLFCSILLLNFFTLIAQNKSDSLVLSINAKWNEKPLELQKKYISINNDTIEITQLKFYLSDIQILFDDNSTIKEKQYHLINIEDLKTMKFSICKKNNPIKKITFSIGVDSSASVSGALAGDLDPSNGMYWAWQSGYINMKIEGTSSSCKTRKNTFKYHIGGFLSPNYALRKVEIPLKKQQIQKQEINLIMDFEKFFSEIFLEKTNSIMIPGKEAMHLANLSTKLFSIE